jgi:hypothetical protein
LAYVTTNLLKTNNKCVKIVFNGLKNHVTIAPDPKTPKLQKLMKKASSYFILASSMLSFTAGITKAQTGKSAQTTLQAPPNTITVDGNLKDWGDSLRYYNDEKKFYYTLANDKTTLYAAIRIPERMDQMKTLHVGITLGIDIHGKKKETFAITFPLADPGSTPEFPKPQSDNGEITKEDRDELLRERVTKLRNIKVEGFKDIEGDMITTSNTYGIKAAIDYDAQGNLVYELAIPLQFFHADEKDIAKNEWAFNFKINGVQRPAGANGSANSDHQSSGGMSGMGGGGGRGGRGGGMGGGGGRGGRGGRGGGMGGNSTDGASHSEMSKSSDFWEKFYLAK